MTITITAVETEAPSATTVTDALMRIAAEEGAPAAWHYLRTRTVYTLPSRWEDSVSTARVYLARADVADRCGRTADALAARGKARRIMSGLAEEACALRDSDPRAVESELGSFWDALRLVQRYTAEELSQALWDMRFRSAVVISRIQPYRLREEVAAFAEGFSSGVPMSELEPMAYELARRLVAVRRCRW
jgi:hypothetical protein